MAQRCLENGVTPYIVTKKTVFKWQESFWVAMKEVFDKYYKEKFEVLTLLLLLLLSVMRRPVCSGLPRAVMC